MYIILAKLTVLTTRTGFSCSPILIVRRLQFEKIRGQGTYNAQCRCPTERNFDPHRDPFAPEGLGRGIKKVENGRGQGRGPTCFGKPNAWGGRK